MIPRSRSRSRGLRDPAAGSGRGRRRTRPLLWGAVGLVLTGAAWIVVTGALARGELLAAGRSLAVLQNPSAARASADPGSADPGSADTATAEARGPGGLAAGVRSAAGHADRAHRYTTGPAWYVASHVPVLGAPLRTVRGAAWAADRVTTDILTPLARVVTGLAGGVREGGGHLDLATLQRSTTALDRAARAASETRAQAGRLPRSTWLPAADRGRALLIRQLDRIAPATADVAGAAHVVPGMMGAQGNRRYLVIFQNSSEARGTGGLPGAFATLTASQGRLEFEDFGNDTAVADARATVDLGKEYAEAYAHNAPSSTWVNANLSPHFPYAAQIWADAWRRHSGKRIDGVIALDPSAMAGLLAVAGPAPLNDGTTVSAANVVDLTERTSYAAFSDTLERKRFFLEVAGAAAGQLISAADDVNRLPPLLAALHKELGEGRVMVWSAHQPEQHRLRRLRFAGVLPSGPAPFAGLVVNNTAGSKLDYYLDRRLAWEPGQCGRDGREVTVTVTLTNRAPASGLPSYVTMRMDKPTHATRPGDNRLMVSYYASTGAAAVGATVDGRPVMMSAATERGHPVYTFDIELPAQTTRTLSLRLLEPSTTTRAPLLWRQPLVTPLRTTVRPYPPCGD